MDLIEIEYQWLCLKYDSVKIAQYFEAGSSIAIYGMGELGRLLARELKDDVDKLFGIDRNARGIISDIPVYTLDTIPYTPDYVVVSVMDDNGGISALLSERLDSKIVSLEDVLYNL